MRPLKAVVTHDVVPAPTAPAAPAICTDQQYKAGEECLGKGSIDYNPHPMKVNKPADVTLKLGSSDAVATPAADSKFARTIDKVQITEYMAATIVNTADFEMIADTPLCEIKVTENGCIRDLGLIRKSGWTWTVKPLHVGNARKLKVRVTSYEKIDGDYKIAGDGMANDYNVDVTVDPDWWYETILKWIKEPTLILTALAALVGAVVTLWIKLRTLRKSLASDGGAATEIDKSTP